MVLAMKKAMKAMKAAGTKKVMKAAMKSKAMKATKAMKSKGMKKAMKAMKAKKTMKAMKKKKAMKVSKIAKGKNRKGAVFNGTKEKTSGGQKKSDLMKNKDGKIVSKKSHAAGKK